MERTLLYYPTIDIPSIDWLYSGLLYSDKISSIVPFWDIDDERFPSTLKYLVDENQYKPIFIQRVLSRYNKDFKEFEDYFISTISSDEFCKLNQKKNEITGDHFEQLYNQKLTDNIRFYLENRGLIKRKNDGTIITDEMVALFYMGVLAQYVAKVEKEDLIIPSTNDKRYEEIAFRISDKKTHTFNFILEKCLPVPFENTPLTKIIEFKKKRRGELIEFRKFISKTQDKLKKAESNEEVKEIQIDTKEAIEKGLLDLERIYKDGGIKTFFSSFESLLKLESPKLFQTLMTIGAITTPINPIVGVATGLVGITGGVASSYLTNKRDIDKSEFSYLFRAKQSDLFN